MRNRLLLFAVLLCGSASFAQVSNYKTVGRNNVTQRDIVAFVHQFDGEIKKATIDTTSNTALITISDDPQAKREVCYDLVSQKKIWSKKLNNQETIVKFGDYFIYASPRTLWKQEKTYRLDGKSGEKKFMIGKGLDYKYVDIEEGFIICSQQPSDESRKIALQKISLETNETLWERQVNVAFDCEFGEKANDSTLLFIASGIHSLNVDDGTGWSFEAVTERLETYYDFPYKYSYLMKCRSNVLVDSVSVTMASVDAITKLDLEGNVVWSSELPWEETSTSRLIKNNDYIVMINNGFSLSDSKIWTVGRPFFAVCDSKTGKMYCRRTHYQNADYFFDARFCDDTLFIISSDENNRFNLEKYRLPDGQFMGKKTFDAVSVEQMGGFICFLGDKMFVKEDSAFVPLINADSNSIYICTKEGLLKFNRKLTVSGNVNYKDCYELLQEHNGVRYFGHQGKIVAVASDDTELATFDFDRMYLSEKKIYSIDNNLLYEIDLEQVVSR